MCNSAKSIKSTVLAYDIRDSAKICLEFGKERALEVDSDLGEWVGEWLPLACRAEII